MCVVVVLLAVLVLVVVVVGGGGGGVTRAASLTRARRGPCATRLCANKPRRFFFSLRSVLCDVLSMGR